MKIKRRYKIAAMVMLMAFVYEITFPTVAFALTSMNTQPEVWGYQPVDATDNVGLTSGKFNYTIPITSIPEYPMAMGYSSGMGMDQEGGVFGFGWNGFSGAISRNMMGLPDDLNGAVKKYNYENQKKWDASVQTSVTAGFKLGDYVTVGPSASVTVGYSNYTGAYGAMGLSLSASAFGVGVVGAIQTDSREYGVRYGAGAGTGISKFLTSAQAGYTIGGIIGKSESTKRDGYASVTSAFDIGKSVFPTVSGTSATSLAPLSYVVPTSTGFGASLTIPIPLPTVPPIMLSVTGAYNQQKFGNGDIDKKAYGFLYLNQYNRRDYDQLADMTIEGESSFNPDSRNVPSYLQRDYFSMNAMGISGTMQLYQKEYGIVSRNRSRMQYRNIGMINIQTDRNEVYPWVNVSRTKQNKGVDILALLKKKEKPESKDFDNALFDEEEIVSLTNPKDKFGDANNGTMASNAVFKMRGDMAGEFDLSSNNFKDHDINQYDLIHIQNTGGGAQFSFMKMEKDMPLYQPVASTSDKSCYDKGENGTEKIEKSTDIKYTTIGQIMSAYTSLSGYDPKAATNTDPDAITNSFNFRQSFYSHYQYAPSTAERDDKKGMMTMNDRQEDMNILKHLKDMSAGFSSLGSMIGSIEVRNTGGLRYFFNLPVFNTVSKSVQLSGKGALAPKTINGDYHSFADIFGGAKDRNKVSEEDKFAYPYAWLLTAIVGDDYIDFDNIPGPSDGDIGYWVKFKYTKACDAYRWRNPFHGMNHLAGAIHDNSDDVYMMNTGQKEIYYLSEIESANYLCKYTMQKRYDAVDAAGEWNGDAYNSLKDNENISGQDFTGKNFQFLVTQIDLYKKHDNGSNSLQKAQSNPGTLIKSTVFQYDYTLSLNVPNNYQVYDGTIQQTDVPYYYNAQSSSLIGTGKATLRKVQHIAYDAGGNPTYLPSYEFKYWGDNDAKYSPAYDKDQKDQWGNYYKNAKAAGTGNPGINYYTPYTELSKTDADDNAKVFNIMDVMLPSGGSMHVDYQAQSYGYVEDKTPYVMRHVTDIHRKSTISTDPDYNISVLRVDITDIGNGPDGLQKVIKPGQQVVGEIAFYQNTKSTASGGQKENEIFISADTAEVVSLGAIDAQPDANGRIYQELFLKDIKSDKDFAPFIYKCEKYMYAESQQMRLIKESFTGTCMEAAVWEKKYTNMENDNPLDVVRKIVANVKSVFIPDEGYKPAFINCFGTPATQLFAHWSYLRTPVYKGKYTGSCVSTLSLKDNFNYGTSTDGTTTVKRENEYGTRYYYDENSDGAGISSGVATIEPGGGASCVIDVSRLTGAGFAPSPTIISSKTTLENLYKDSPGAVAGDKISRKKGKTVYEFYTPKDQGMQFTSYFKQGSVKNAEGNPNGKFYMFGLFSFFLIKFKIFKKTIKIKVPFWVPIAITWNRYDQYFMKSYAYTDYTDIYGRPKSITQKDAENKDIGMQNFTYYGLDEDVPVYKNTFGSAALDKKPGKMDQVWSEAYYTKEANMNLFAVVLNAETHRNFCYTNMKYSYVPPMLKEVRSTLDGMITSTQNTGFDYYTGSPVEVRSNDSYNNTKIVRTEPAYWNYTNMGPSFEDENKVNNLNATTGTYMYLNQVDDNHLLGVGIVEWADNSEKLWNTIDYLQPKKQYVDATNYKYVYTQLSGSAVQSAYSSANRNSDKTATVRRIERNPVLFRTYRGYTYETELNDETAVDASGKSLKGTFKGYTSTNNFNYPHGAGNMGGWKLLSTNQLYAANGVLVQSKDVLSKYASQLLGYNYSNTVGAVSNGSWGASVFEGAENTYGKSSGDLMLEGNRVKLEQASVIEACGKTFTGKTLSYNTFPPLTGNAGETNKGGRVITIKPPVNLVYNVPFAKLDIVYNNSLGIKRSLYISLKDNGDYQVVSNAGEDFTGFFTYPQADGSVQLVFNPNDFSAFAKDLSFPSQGYTVNYVPGAYLLVTFCANNKSYQVPDNDCMGEVHTGNYAFRLEGNDATGTRYTLSSSTVSQDEFNRKYKALVWVYNASPSETELVMQVKDNFGRQVSSEVVASMASPYAKAGNWSLLRIDFDLSNYHYSTNQNLSDYAEVFVRNRSKSGIAIYDDLRILPYHADMTNWVFDHQFNRVVSGLDNDHFASYSNYDARGRVTESAVEVQNTGKTTVQKFLYNDQKKN